MTVTYRQAQRENVPLLIGLAGGTGSGKTYSAMLIAQGLAGDKRFAVIDTENGRARHYADTFQFDVADLNAPFRPEAYTEAILAADGKYPVIVVDSMSHEWAGDGGLLDWQTEELGRMGGRDAMKMASWIAPKMAHRKFVTRLLQIKAHLILCFRAAEKIEMVRNEQGKMEVIPKRSLVGLDGWIPITEKDLPFELTMSCLLLASAPGVPNPIKLPEQLRPFVPLDRPLDATVGLRLSEWSAGSGQVEKSLERELLELADKLGMAEQTTAAMKRHLGDVPWLQAQIAKAKAALAARAPEPATEELQFEEHAEANA